MPYQFKFSNSWYWYVRNSKLLGVHIPGGSVKLGPRVRKAYRNPEKEAAIGNVRSHARTKKGTGRQLTALREPLQRPTPMVAPTMQCVEETGRPRKEAVMMARATPSSMQKPREGEWSVSLLPMLRSTL